MEESFYTLVSGRRRGIGPSLLRGLLRIASVPYGWGAGVRNRLFDWGWKPSERVTVPVVSVGNLTLGGTGKTPCVAEHGRNDEALVLEKDLPGVPHLQVADRVALAKTAVEELESEVLVLDDGFQHRRLARDLDVVLVDATEPWGLGYLFPRGLLRESPRGLNRAGVVMLTRCDQVAEETRARLRQEVSRLAPQAPLVETKHGPVELVGNGQQTESLALLSARPVAAFCGIGNPDAFRRTLTDQGAAVCAFRTFPDHHLYSRADVDDLRHWAREQPTDCVVVTTQKDLVKLRLSDLAGRPLWALRIRLQALAEGGTAALDQQLRSIVPAA